MVRQLNPANDCTPVEDEEDPVRDVVRKLRFEGPAAIINAPPEIEDAFVALGHIASLPQSSAQTLFFIRDRQEFLDRSDAVLEAVEEDSLFWIAYPKKTSKLSVDLDRKAVWELGMESGIRPVTQIAIDDDWSALRFRPVDRVKSRSRPKGQ
jgi:hypothetical protein